MRVRLLVPLGIAIAALLLAAGCGDDAPSQQEPQDPTFAGSASCRDCHERFYQLWAPSHHGKAMQPYTPAFAEADLTAQADPIVVGDHSYRADIDKGVVLDVGPDGEKDWPIVHVMGGKNVFFFLTPLDRGRLQVLPLAYDVRDESWYDTTGSMIRHAVGHTDDPVEWRDSLLTFNTSCWNCHVSQLSVNYDAEADTYESTWAEPGINCETCHGPASEHVRVFKEAGDGEMPEDLHLISMSTFDEAQTDATCAPCHAKSIALTTDFSPGDLYFDHFDLTCLEDRDFYPDGRDLGENYTFTLSRMNPCSIAGELDCVHCHTSSGRTRHTGEDANQLCMPCHEERVKTAPAHTHHPEGSIGNRCVSCHMPMTTFARMRRSDHSLRPPMPAVSKKYGSPDACTICHKGRDADWADAHVREWHEDDFQAPVLHAAGLVAAAREGDWERLDEMLAYITSRERGEIFATTLIRLLRSSRDPKKVPALLSALEDPSPLVRSSAASGLTGWVTPEVVHALLDATKDDTRLVRVRAAGALSGLPPGDLPEEVRASLAAATAELDASLIVRPDSWTTPYNLGNLYEQRGEHDRALASYVRATRMRPDAVAPWVNMAMLHARQGSLGEAENALRRGLEVGPDDAAVNFNLGLLLVERKRPEEAKQRLRAALKADPNLAGAAYNLAGLLVETHADEALALYRRAWRLDPGRQKYVEALVWALRKAGKTEEAAAVMEQAQAGQR